jgi:hypothetical protein
LNDFLTPKRKDRKGKLSPTMKRAKPNKNAKTSSQPEKISAEEALKRMKSFRQRKEKMIAFISQSKN